MISVEVMEEAGTGAVLGCALGVWMGSVTLRPVSCRSRQNQSLAGIRCASVPGLGGRAGFKFLSVTSAAVVMIPVPAWVSGLWDKEGTQRRTG